MNEITIRLFGMELLSFVWGEQEDDDKPEEKVDPAGISLAEAERAPVRSAGVWGDGHERPEPIQLGFR